MGQKHLEQMYDDALAVDCRAMALVVDLLSPTQVEYEAFGSGFWDPVPLDATMEVARGINDLEDQFYDDMKQLLVDKKLDCIMFDVETGEPVRVFDPKVVDYDIKSVTPSEFFKFMRYLTTPPKSCSGEQNAD